jgi:multidrug efflux system membrane fusion protein
MKKSYLLAFIIAVVVALWIGSGFFLETDPSRQEIPVETANEKNDLMRVQVKTIAFEPYIKKISVNGRSEASKDVTLRAEAEGQIVEILHDQGQTIARGEQIVKIDIREKSERVREARELVKQRRIEYEAAKKLIKQGFASDVRLAQTQSAFESARASLKRAEIDLEKTTVVAPFDGVLGQRHVDVGDYVSFGDAITDIVDLDPLKIVVFVNENEIVQLQKGNRAMIKFPAIEPRQGEVKFIAPSANRDTRTFRVEIQMDNTEDPLPAGLTAQVDIDVLSKQATKIPPSILTLNDDGDVGVKVIDGENKARFTAIDIIEDTPEYLWVTGLDEGARVVMVGQNFLVPGQEVEPVEQ